MTGVQQRKADDPQGFAGHAYMAMWKGISGMWKSTGVMYIIHAYNSATDEFIYTEVKNGCVNPKRRCKAGDVIGDLTGRSDRTYYDMMDEAAAEDAFRKQLTERDAQAVADLRGAMKDTGYDKSFDMETVRGDEW